MAISGRIGLALVMAWIVVALLGPGVAPHGVAEVVHVDVFDTVSRRFPLGTDYLGRDMLSRVLYGARYTVLIAFVATGIAAAAGILLGLAAAAGGWVDIGLSRTFDIVIAIPSLMLALVVIAATGASIPVLIGTLALIYTPGAFRTARALAMGVMALDFVAAARARGERLPYIVVREALPNVTGPLAADFGLRFVFVVLLLSGLSFLGLGVQPPQADLGALVRENIAGLGFGAPAVLFPAVAIASLTIGMNLVIDSLPGRRRR
ncbi:DNA-directed RNA polymerase subunit alpha [Sphingomonas sp. Sph1(2015)]|jgi:peptide/nickel transport system permease protein|uniref:ABC transporter permease n=1 Tax=Sphingomonas sp. Sph1(2015) TaxID=1628084 RepID=UPI0009760589|nr:ABC transporter permease [Sphingomonas sp. Sph1(2015)]OMJ31565.1 DNA-directed RNA polymerase subunit alpha [Sphingomonas sp. Sph1(2015)]